jgi:hypothetical protein
MKPRIFVGSSTEGLPVATLVAKMLSDVADCQLWNEGFFEFNKNSFDSLCEGSLLFDFAILVATSDDVTLKRDNLKESARDNIIFEFGLYVGRLGTGRSLLLKEKGVDLPSDFYGISLPEFNYDKADPEGALKKVTADIRQHILKQAKRYELSFIPSTAIAIGYFENMILKVCRELVQLDTITADDHQFKTFLLNVVVPDELPDDFNDQVIMYLNSNKLKKMEVKTNTRPYNFYLKYADADDTTLYLYDLPTTLTAIKRSIELSIKKSYVGESDRENILKRKEMQNFKNTLQELIEKNPVTKNNVKIIPVDVK